MKSKFYIVLMLLTTFWSAAFAITFTTTQVNGSSEKSIAVESGVQQQLSFDFLHQNTSDVRLVISDGSSVTYVDESNLADGYHSYVFVPGSTTVVVKFVRVDNDNTSRTFEVNNLTVGTIEEGAETSNSMIGKKEYEVVDHQGNVRVVMNDALINGKSEIVSSIDYLPFGMVARKYKKGVNTYSFGMQGQLTTDEMHGEGNWVDFKYRSADPRLGRFFAIDPLYKKYPWYTPYQFSGNKVIHAVELEGLEEHVLTETHDAAGKVTGQTLTFDEKAKPLGEGKIYVISVNSKGVSSLPAEKEVSTITYKGSYLTPTPAPKSILGTVNYYNFRKDDFNVRHGLLKDASMAPEYYMNFGGKYAKRFTSELRPKLSAAGQKWVDKARLNLQVAMETKLASVTKKDDIEKNNKAFEEFAFGTHADAYISAGLKTLTYADLVNVMTTPDLAEWKKANTWSQAIQVTPTVLKKIDNDCGEDGGIAEWLRDVIPKWMQSGYD
ncbi:MAG: hypothetical protein NT150_07600 [Bacteroidetes bacterium]|nr:hypothetical protein [Bacteroidota bacterium]